MERKLVKLRYTATVEVEVPLWAYPDSATDDEIRDIEVQNLVRDRGDGSNPVAVAIASGEATTTVEVAGRRSYIKRSSWAPPETADPDDPEHGADHPCDVYWQSADGEEL